MKRIDIVMAQSKNENRDSLISGYCPHDFIEGIDISDCSKISCGTCWNRDDDETERQDGSFDIRSQLAESIVDDFGDDIKFAVPPSGENINEIVNGIDEYAEIRIEALKFEVLDLLKERRTYLLQEYVSIPHYQIDILKADIEKIFEKY